VGTTKIRIDGTTLGAVNRLLGVIGLLVGLAFLFVVRIPMKVIGVPN
jgi:hypothetical protein